MDWIAIKTDITNALGLSRDALHVLSGVGAQLFLVLLFRSWLGAIWPVVVITLATLGNEWLDLTTEEWVGELRTLQWWESAKDLALTVAPPGVLVLLCRLAPGRFVRPPRSEGPAADAGPELPTAPDALEVRD